MKLISYFLGKLTSFTVWSTWWDSSKTSDAPLTLAIALIFLAIYWCLSAFVKNRSAAPQPPGPRGLPLLGHLPFLDPELHSYFADLARIHGPILQLRLGSKVGVVVTSPELARQILKDQDITFANRDIPQAAIEVAYGGSDIAWTPYGPEWRMLRRVCVREMLSGTALDSVHYLRHREFRQTVSHLYSKAGSLVNVGEQTFLTFLNVITSMMWGGTVKGEERGSLGAEFRQLVMEITELLGKPNISDFYPGLARFDLQGVRKKMKGLALRFDRIFNSVIEQRIEMDKQSGNEGGKDFLQLLLNLKDEEDSQTPFTMTHLKALLMVHFLPLTFFSFLFLPFSHRSNRSYIRSNYILGIRYLWVCIKILNSLSVTFCITKEVGKKKD